VQIYYVELLAGGTMNRQGCEPATAEVNRHNFTSGGRGGRPGVARRLERLMRLLLSSAFGEFAARRSAAAEMSWRRARRGVWTSTFAEIGRRAQGSGARDYEL
jgi:hypothetical protein